MLRRHHSGLGSWHSFVLAAFIELKKAMFMAVIQQQAFTFNLADNTQATAAIPYDHNTPHIPILVIDQSSFMKRHIVGHYYQM